MPPDEEPQASGTAVQDAPAPAAPTTSGGGFDRAGFIDRMVAQYPGDDGDAGESEPQAQATGTGSTEPGAATTEPAKPAEPDLDAPAPLNDPTAFAAWLDARDARAERTAKERLDNQRRSILGDVEAERRRNSNEALLKELDELDDEELADRIRSGDRKAIEAIATRVQSSGADVQAAAKMEVVTQQVPLMLQAAKRIADAGGPSLHAMLADPDGAEYQAMVKAEGGVFAWLTEQAWQAGGKDAVTRFKQSAEYRNAIEQAKQDAVRDGYSRIGGPPPRDDARPPNLKVAPAQYDNPRQRAVARAMQMTGVNDVDIDEFNPRRRTA